MTNRTKIDVLANVATIVAAAALVGLFWRTWDVQKTTTAHAAGTLAVGATFPSIPSLDIHSHAKGTMVLFISSSCHFCIDSLPFYRRLVDLRTGGHSDIGIVAVGYESAESLRDFLRANSVSVDGAFQLNPRLPELSGTPTLILIDKDGKVRSVWVGRLQAAEEAEVARFVS